MSLQKNQNQSQSPLLPKEEMSRLYAQILSIQERNLQDSENKYQAILMFTTLEKICQTLTDFMTATENQLRKSSESQLKSLNAQSHYTDKLDDEVRKMVQNNYNIFQKEQEKFLENIHVKWDNSAKKLVNKIEKTADECNKAAGRAEKTAEELSEAVQGRELLYFITLFLLLADVAFRVVPWVVGLFG